MALSKTTKDHQEIQRWAEARGAVPSEVASTHSKGEPGILRFQFPHAPQKDDAALNEISWDEFFEKFDANNLELIYQEQTAAGAASNFNKLIHPESEKKSSFRKSTAKKAASATKKAASSRKKTSITKKSTGARKKSSPKKSSGAKKSAAKPAAKKSSASASRSKKKPATSSSKKKSARR